MKSWKPTIEQHIQTWSAKLGNLSWWPTYVYHFTDVRNAVRILENGCLFSRQEAIRRNLMCVDNASPNVMQRTRTEHQQFVRLYFRPRTPTQFRNEGIRPLGQRELGGAHCPVPIYFCFDALDILCRDDCEFSDGNMGSPKAQHSNSEKFFSAIPFQHVYHSGAIYEDEDKDEIVFRRNAEVLVPDQLRLDQSLKAIACRSTAEMQTLLQLLPDAVRAQWVTRVRLGERFYERKWTFVEEVVTVDDRIIFRFNPDTIVPGPFRIKFTYEEDNEPGFRVWEGKEENIRSPLVFAIKNASAGIATLTLDDSLAFYGKVIFTDIPF